MANGNEFDGLEQVIDAVIELGDDQSEVSVGDMQKKIGQRSFGPFLFVPAIIEISPVGEFRACRPCSPSSSPCSPCRCCSVGTTSGYRAF